MPPLDRTVKRRSADTDAQQRPTNKKGNDAHERRLTGFALRRRDTKDRGIRAMVVDPTLTNEQRHHEGEILGHYNVLQDPRLDLRKELGGVDRIFGRRHFPMRLEKLLGLLLDPHFIDRLLKQSDRRPVLLGLATNLLRILQRRELAEVVDYVASQFRRRLGLFLCRPLLKLLNALCA